MPLPVNQSQVEKRKEETEGCALGQRSRQNPPPADDLESPQQPRGVGLCELLLRRTNLGHSPGVSGQLGLLPAVFEACRLFQVIHQKGQVSLVKRRYLGRFHDQAVLSLRLLDLLEGWILGSLDSRHVPDCSPEAAWNARGRKGGDE